MTLWSAETGAWLMQAVAAASDTLLFKQVGEEPTTFQKITGVASGLVSIALLVLTVFLVPAAWNFRKSYAKVSGLLDKVYADINPITKHLSAIADNLDYITTSVRVDIQQVNQTVAAANERVQRALEISERRVKELNALLQVVQEEAEDTFVSTAAALRGVRAGALAFGEPPLDDVMEDLDDAMDDEVITEHYEELDDGNDSTDTHERATTGPRIRPRRPGGAA
jgi:uncharacterized protein YoxC